MRFESGCAERGGNGCHRASKDWISIDGHRERGPAGQRFQRKSPGAAIEIERAPAGQILTQKYDVTVNDGHGGTAIQTITITIKGDKKKEGDEDFFINLFNPSNALIDRGQGRVVIKNDD